MGQPIWPGIIWILFRYHPARQCAGELEIAFITARRTRTINLSFLSMWTVRSAKWEHHLLCTSNIKKYHYHKRQFVSEFAFADLSVQNPLCRSSWRPAKDKPFVRKMDEIRYCSAHHYMAAIKATSSHSNAWWTHCRLPVHLGTLCKSPGWQCQHTKRFSTFYFV